MNSFHDCINMHLSTTLDHVSLWVTILNEEEADDDDDDDYSASYSMIFYHLPFAELSRIIAELSCIICHPSILYIERYVIYRESFQSKVETIREIFQTLKFPLCRCPRMWRNVHFCGRLADEA